MKLSKSLKRWILLINAILFFVSSGFALVEWKTPKFVEQKNVLFSYRSKGNIDYKVYLKPNIIYDGNFIEEGKYYIFKYIDHIEAVFKYEYAGSSTAELRTEYSVKAYLQGLHGAEDEVLWSKSFVLIPAKVEESKVSGKTIEKKIDIPLENYASLRENYYLDTRVNSPVVLNIVFDIHTVAKTEHGILKETLSPNLLVPIGETVFRMDGKPDVTGGNKIEETIMIKVPFDLRKIILLVTASLILIVTFIFVLRTEEEEQPDDFQKEIKTIFNEYGERLAGMEQPLSYHISDIINVNSVEDMVKIADEVGQPVFYYKVDTRTERKIEFYVFDNTRVYYMVIFGEIEKSNEENNGEIL